MIDCLIFSKDRPAQLDLLLRSIEKHAPNLYRSTTVLWTFSDTAKGYDICATENQTAIQWWCESDFEDCLREWLGRAGEVVSFLVDDDVFYRDAAEPLELPWSYRGGDYDYPFSVDGNVYAKADVEKLLHGLHFRNPSELEAFAHEKRRRLPFTEVAHGQPCLVGIPANRVSLSSGMPCMATTSPWLDADELNRRYLAGERLALPEAGWSLPAHARLEYRWAEPVTA